MTLDRQKDGWLRENAKESKETQTISSVAVRRKIETPADYAQ